MPSAKAKLSREALAAAPWAAHLVASFPPPPGGDASSRRAPGTSGSPAELEAEVEAETRALLAARAASAAAASTAPSIPTFFRPKSDVGFLAAELRNIAHRVALQYKERGLLEDDELEALWNAITDVIARRPPDTPSPSSALRVLPMPPDGAPAEQADAESRACPTTNFIGPSRVRRAIGRGASKPPVAPARAASTTATRASRTISPRVRSTGSNATSAVA